MLHHKGSGDGDYHQNHQNDADGAGKQGHQHREQGISVQKQCLRQAGFRNGAKDEPQDNGNHVILIQLS